MIGCAYCGNIIGNEKYNSIEFIGYWNHVKNKHWKLINSKTERANLPAYRGLLE